MKHRPPVKDRFVNGGRSLALLVSLAVLVASLLGFMFNFHSDHTPTDPGTPATVTTIGGPR